VAIGSATSCNTQTNTAVSTEWSASGQFVDIGGRHPVADATDRLSQHRGAQVESDDVDVVAPQPAGDHAGTDAEFDHARAGDPRGEVVGEVIAAAFAASRGVVDLGDAIERGPRHECHGTTSQLTRGSRRAVACDP
jgi:hypothetical protein